MIPFTFTGPLAIGLVVVLLFAGTYFKGRFDGRHVCDQRVTELLENAAAQERYAQRQALEASTALENAHARTEIKYRTIVQTVNQVVEKPVYRDQCLDADGLRLANAALTRSAPASGQPLVRLP